MSNVRLFRFVQGAAQIDCGDRLARPMNVRVNRVRSPFRVIGPVAIQCCLERSTSGSFDCHAFRLSPCQVFFNRPLVVPRLRLEGGGGILVVDRVGIVVNDGAVELCRQLFYRVNYAQWVASKVSLFNGLRRFAKEVSRCRWLVVLFRRFAACYGGAARNQHDQ